MASPLQRKLKITGPTVVTANRLRDGVVVWLKADGGWSEALAEAAVGTTSDEVLDLLDIAQSDESIAVGPYAARIDLDTDGRPVPGNLRERIRCQGPTIAYGDAAGAH
ncbi:DUF2849 domain-containing protein [Xanthobacter sp. TB0136]|uniref:DUF2849 domain-containing protein n=1 Tax=Xanthobacter sp. TB0136 TaxID=3459177 RepID=UPI00403992B4